MDIGAAYNREWTSLRLDPDLSGLGLARAGLRGLSFYLGDGYPAADHLDVQWIAWQRRWIARSGLRPFPDTVSYAAGASTASSSEKSTGSSRGSGIKVLRHALEHCGNQPAWLQPAADSRPGRPAGKSSRWGSDSTGPAKLPEGETRTTHRSRRGIPRETSSVRARITYQFD